MTAFAIVTVFGAALVALLIYAAWRSSLAQTAEQSMSAAIIICIIGAANLVTWLIWWVMFIRLAIA